MLKHPPAAPPASAAQPRAVQLSADDAEIWRGAIEAREDAVRLSEIALLRSKLAIAEAVETQLGMVRGMAEKYGFDARGQWTLDRTNTLTPGAEAGR